MYHFSKFVYEESHMPGASVFEELGRVCLENWGESVWKTGASGFEKHMKRWNGEMGFRLTKKQR